MILELNIVIGLLIVFAVATVAAVVGIWREGRR